MEPSKNCNGVSLSVVGTAIAIAIAEKVTTDEANLLGALFNVIGDQLTLIATANTSGGDGNQNNHC
ncbi:MAG: hypothetical protein E7518_03945 [Ruminococcaceae bacterium]|nr:hypothetical protein [Oscillospiraceae bacterium]HHV32050.1 hypothetical protein [Clostridiales bacterium]